MTTRDGKLLELESELSRAVEKLWGDVHRLEKENLGLLEKRDLLEARLRASEDACAALRLEQSYNRNSAREVTTQTESVTLFERSVIANTNEADLVELRRDLTREQLWKAEAVEVLELQRETVKALQSKYRRVLLFAEELQRQLKVMDHHCASHTCEDDQAEEQHFREVVASFQCYRVEALKEVHEFAASVLSRLPNTESKVLELDAARLVDETAAAIKLNQEICDMIVMAYDKAQGGMTVSRRNMSKVRSTLRQFVREWSQVGATERDQAFRPLLDGLIKYLPRVADDGRRAKVLCPGSGLGRLVFEVCRAGYSCQGNEFSYQMLLGANLMLNCGVEAESLALYPYVLSRTSRKTSQSQFRKIQFPDTAVHEAQLEEDIQMSMTAGEFVEAYKHDQAVWDGLTTCFFLDTAKNILQYIRLFAQVVRPQGVWTNIGPLLYHFADQPEDMSLELSWGEIKQIMSKYFVIQEEREVMCKYTSCDDFMINTVYRCIHFVALRNKVSVDGSSNSVYP